MLIKNYSKKLEGGKKNFKTKVSNLWGEKIPPQLPTFEKQTWIVCCFKVRNIIKKIIIHPKCPSHSISQTPPKQNLTYNGPNHEYYKYLIQKHTRYLFQPKSIFMSYL